MVPGAFLAGKDIVRDCMEDPVISSFLHDAIQEEIIPTLTLPREELQSFAASVEERFNNPFIDHALLSITLNCTSKWKARVLPSLKGYLEKFGTLPRRLTASFAFYLAFYRGVRLEEDGLIGLRGDEEYRISDDRAILEFFDAHKEDDAAAFTHAVCTQTAFWGEDLSKLPGFESEVTALLEKLQSVGTYEVMKELSF
jgi:tagaturonate reductase